MTAVTLEISPVREPMQPRILIADDQQDVLDALRLLLKGHGYSIETVNSPADLLAAVGLEAVVIVPEALHFPRRTTARPRRLRLLQRLDAKEVAPPVPAVRRRATRRP